MPRKIMRPIFWSILFVVLVGFACNLGGSGEAEPAAPTEAPQQAQPTQPPAPTNTPIPEPTSPPPPTNTPLPEPTEPPPPTETEAGPEVYYIEEFDNDLSNYSYFLQRGDDRGDEMLYTANGALTFDLSTQNTWVYVTYDPWSYKDVRIGLRAENRGNNSQNISLFCRHSPDGWFEFNIGGDGLYDILARDNTNNFYYNIFNGGSNLINIGKDSNEYIAECIGNTLTLYINGQMAREVTIPQDYRFMEEGKVGFSVSSFDSIPILVNIDWFGIEAP